MIDYLALMHARAMRYSTPRGLLEVYRTRVEQLREIVECRVQTCPAPDNSWAVRGL